MKEVHWGVSSFAWLETKYGRLFSLNPPAHHDQYERLAYQPYIVSWLESKEYGLFIDCGAYIGLYTFVGSFHCRRVISYEASPFIFGILLFNLRHKFNVDCIYAWVGKKEQVHKAKEEDLQMVTSQRSFAYKIPTVELDMLLETTKKYEKIFIKIDIEGNEINALERATELLKLKNVHWIIDCHRQHNIFPDDIKKFFPNRHSYNIADILVIKGDKSESNDPIFKGWKRLE